ncbi:uncharacterized protein LOC107006483 [Solanum pennellii]|uniref:Uncharacterized protein LOC107006483 n=1 Tax=Solanum pennellii TaxID=28526 RepID=A0ABM1FR35_SOLPN|nr:uncharacterized protein LOC107006483 [Solanum pennellii]
MDFIVGLPTTVGCYGSIWVVVDRLTKSAHFIPVRVKYTAEKLVELYISQIVRLHGVPISIISDRGSLFTSHFWKALQRGLGTQLYMSMAFHPQTDGQSERTIQVFEDMLRECVINFGATWDLHLPFAEFAYNNSYHSNIQMAPFEALYGRRCRCLIGWFDSVEMDSLDTDLLRDAMEQVLMIQYRLLIPQSRQKSYTDRRFRALVFMEGVHVWLRVSPMKGVIRFGKKVHPVFHVSMLRKYISDESHVLSLDSVELGPDLTFEEEPIAILDRQVRKLRTKEIASVKVQWEHQSVGEANRRALQYLTLTRPDRSFTVNKVCQYMHILSISQWASVKRILRYLQHSHHVHLYIPKSTFFSLQAFSDSDWAGSLNDRKSSGGYAIFLGSSLLGTVHQLCVPSPAGSQRTIHVENWVPSQGP